jgi:hypothetical protein
MILCCSFFFDLPSSYLFKTRWTEHAISEFNELRKFLCTVCSKCGPLLPRLVDEHYLKRALLLLLTKWASHGINKPSHNSSHVLALKNFAWRTHSHCQMLRGGMQSVGVSSCRSFAILLLCHLICVRKFSLDWCPSSHLRFWYKQGDRKLPLSHLYNLHVPFAQNVGGLLTKLPAIHMRHYWCLKGSLYI